VSMCHMPCSRATNGASAWWSPTSGSAMVEINGCEVGGRGIESRRRQHLLIVLIQNHRTINFHPRTAGSVTGCLTPPYCWEPQLYSKTNAWNILRTERLLRLVTDGYTALILRTAQPGFFLCQILFSEFIQNLC
jgi:hypothetical protein